MIKDAADFFCSVFIFVANYFESKVPFNNLQIISMN